MKNKQAKWKTYLLKILGWLLVFILSASIIIPLWQLVTQGELRFWDPETGVDMVSEESNKRSLETQLFNQLIAQTRNTFDVASTVRFSYDNHEWSHNIEQHYKEGQLTTYFAKESNGTEYYGNNVELMDKGTYYKIENNKTLNSNINQTPTTMIHFSKLLIETGRDATYKELTASSYQLEKTVTDKSKLLEFLQFLNLPFAIQSDVSEAHIIATLDENGWVLTQRVSMTLNDKSFEVYSRNEKLTETLSTNTPELTTDVLEINTLKEALTHWMSIDAVSGFVRIDSDTNTTEDETHPPRVTWFNYAFGQPDVQLSGDLIEGQAFGLTRQNNPENEYQWLTQLITVLSEQENVQKLNQETESDEEITPIAFRWVIESDFDTYQSVIGDNWDVTSLNRDNIEDVYGLDIVFHPITGRLMQLTAWRFNPYSETESLDFMLMRQYDQWNAININLMMEN